MKQFIKSLFNKEQPKQFILPMNLQEGEIHKTMFVSEERIDSLHKQIDEVINHAEEYNIVREDSKGVHIDGPILLNILVNKICKTEAERVVVLIQFDKMISTLKRKHFGHHPLESLLDILKKH
jgi:hypothetical protein